VLRFIFFPSVQQTNIHNQIELPEIFNKTVTELRWLFTFGEGGGRQVILIPIAVTTSQIVELSTKQTAKRGPNDWAFSRRFSKSSSEQVNVTHVPREKVQNVYFCCPA